MHYPRIHPGARSMRHGRSITALACRCKSFRALRCPLSETGERLHGTLLFHRQLAVGDMSYQVFISYSSKNSKVANAVCAHLETAQIRCWIAPRDVMPGNYGASIVDGISACSVMVVILTAESNVSPHVSKEVERAVSKGCIVVPFRLEDVTLAKSLEYFLSSEHWLDAITPPLEAHISRLGTTIKTLLADDDTRRDERRRPAASEDDEKRWKDIRMFNELAPDDWTSSDSAGVLDRIKRMFKDR